MATMADRGRKERKLKKLRVELSGDPIYECVFRVVDACAKRVCA